MRRALYLAGALVAIGVAGTVPAAHEQPTSAASAAVTPIQAPATTANVEMPALTPDEERALARRFSPERLAAIRARVRGDVQRAVRDGAEQAFREPTAAEAAALGTRPAPAETGEVPLAGGGAALKADFSSLEFVKATVGSDGTVVKHDGEGARNDQ